MRAPAVAALLALGAMLTASAPAAAAAPMLTPIGSFTNPVLVTAPSGDPHRVFVVERGGKVKIVRDGATLAEPFLDVSADLDPDRIGLTSMAFAPDYATSGYVYVLYDAPDAAGTTPGVDVVVDRYTRSSADANRVDPASRVQILRLDFSNTSDHDANHLAFGPDGLLYVSVGDGATDVNKAQDPHAMRGKLLRIDPLPDGSYRIPRNNPFANDGGDPRVFAYGMRNPWRFSFDADHRQVAIADVADGHWEEVDVLNIDTGGGDNLGWPCWEGTAEHNTDGPCTAPPPAQTPPLFEYDHLNGRCAIIGGPVVRDPSLPDLEGRYLYGDFCTGELRSIALDATAPDDRSIGVDVPPFGLSSFGEDGCGHVYVVSQGDPSAIARIDEGAYVPCPDPNATPPSSDTPPPSTETPPPTTETPPATTETSPIALPPADRTAPRLRLMRARLQHVTRKHDIVVGARCNERCSLTASARFSHAGIAAARHFQPTSRNASAGRVVKLVLHVTPQALKALKRIARKGHRALVRIEVRARDSAGNLSRATCYVAAR